MMAERHRPLQADSSAISLRFVKNKVSILNTARYSLGGRALVFPGWGGLHASSRAVLGRPPRDPPCFLRAVLRAQPGRA